MNTKLTLRLDKSVIDQIKIYALKHQLTLSAMTENFYKSILNNDTKYPEEVASPIAKKYRGIIKDKNINYDNLKYDYLKEKHLK